MTQLERTIRTSRATGIKADNLMEATMVAELISPSTDLWLVSPWISDVIAVDNSYGFYDDMFENPPNQLRLAATLGILSARGCRVKIATRPDPHNDAFLDRVTSAGPEIQVAIDEGEWVHEKTFCGQNWIITGSMNFTLSGMERNDEHTTYRYGGGLPSQTRIDLSARWTEQLSVRD